MKNLPWPYVLYLLLSLGCVDDNASSFEPCQTDDECSGRCVDNFCQPTGNAQGQGGNISEGNPEDDMVTQTDAGGLPNAGSAGSGGIAGESGPSGASGTSGEIGNSGESGSSGEAGNPGESGTTSDAGDPGDTDTPDAAIPTDEEDLGSEADSQGEAGTSGEGGTSGQAGETADTGIGGELSTGGSENGQVECVDDTRRNLSTETALVIELPVEVNDMHLCAMTTDWYRFLIRQVGRLKITVIYTNADITLYTGLRWGGDTTYHPVTQETTRTITHEVTPGEHYFVVGNMTAGERGTDYDISFEFFADEENTDGVGGDAGDGDISGEGGTSNSGGAAGGDDDDGMGGVSGATDCRMGTPELPSSAMVGAFAPSARINTLDIPSTLDEASNAGCQSEGSNNGIGISSLLNLLGASDLGQFYDIENRTAIHQLLHFEGWQAGLRGDQVNPLLMNIYDGIYAAGNMRANPLSFDSEGNPASQFAANISGCNLTAQGDRFSIVPGDIGADAQILSNLAITHVRVFGSVEVDETGVSLRDTTFNGYIHRNSLIELVDLLKMTCTSGNPPAYCNQIATFLGGSSAFIVDILLAPILRGFDAQITDSGTVTGACNRSSCNAISVCLITEATPIEVN